MGGYDLEERTFQFAKRVRMFAKDIPFSIAVAEDIKQAVRSSGSIGANYIEANESSSDKDFLYRIKISRKEAKESIYWLRLLKETSDQLDSNRMQDLIDEANELRRILSSIIKKRSGSE